MKTKTFSILIILLITIVSCGKDENLRKNNGSINFRDDKKVSDVIVRYNEIIGYDSTNYVFRIEKSAWERIKDKTSFELPYFGIGVAANNEIIYTAKYIPGYISSTYNDIITIMLIEPDLVYMKLGYPGSMPELFTGEDLRNDLRLINQLKKDNKLIEIGDYSY